MEAQKQQHGSPSLEDSTEVAATSATKVSRVVRGQGFLTGPANCGRSRRKGNKRCLEED